MARPALIGIGGPAVGAVVEQLGAVPGLAARVELHLSPDMPGGRPRAPAEVLARAVVVLTEPGAMDEAERAALAPSCAVITLPRLEFASLWPLMAEHPPRGPHIPAIPAHFGDRIALEVLRADLPPASRRAAYDAVAVSALEDLDRLHAEMARALFRHEAGCDIRIAAFVLSRFRAERLFHSAVHPSGALMHQVMAQLLGHPALAALADGSFDSQLRAVAPGLDGLFADAQAPIHPDVAAHFKLAWWSTGLRYRQGETTRNFGEAVDWHLREPPGAVRLVLPAGPGIAALPAAVADVATLYPATDVVRAAPFFATAINPDIAPRGAALLSANSGRYHAAAAQLASLAEAVVLCRAGAVLHGGAVLGDTLAPGARLPTATLPAAQRIEGRGFLGIGPGWEADPHGMATILPRLVACARLRRQHPDLRLLLPEAAAAPWLGEMLALLGLAPHVAWLPDAPVACAGLVVTSRFDTEAVSPFAHGAALALAALVKLAPLGPPRLYLRSAATTGTLTNEAAVAAALTAHGFTVLDADTTPLPARIAALRHAAVVVAAQGPALAEIAFCPPGAAVLELVGPADPALTFWSLASCAGLNYGYIVGDPVGPAAPGGAYEVPLAMLDHAAGMIAAG